MTPLTPAAVQAEADRWPCPHCDATCPHGTGEQAELAPGEGGRPHFVTGMTVIGMPEPPEPIGWQNAPDLADILDGTENRDRLDPFTRLAPPDAALPPTEAWKPAPVIGRTLDEVCAAFDDAALPPLPDGWREIPDNMSPRPGGIARWKGPDNVYLYIYRWGAVKVFGEPSAADLLIVLRHAQAAQQRLRQEADRG